MKKWLSIIGVALVCIILSVVSIGCTPIQPTTIAQTTTIAGQAGVGISSIVNGSDGTVTFYLTNGTSYITPDLRGLKGDTGATGLGIKTVNYSQNTGILAITLSDNSIFITGDLRGQAGIPGAQGLQGVAGRGITSTVYNPADGKITLTFSDGTTYITGDLRGANGTNGVDGINGTNGVDGVNGIDGNDGIYYFENPFTGLAVCDAVNGGSLGGSAISGYGVFSIIGACSISGEVNTAWTSSGGYTYQHITGWITIHSFVTGIDYNADIEGYQGYTNPLTNDIFAGTYTFTSGASGSGSITATITDETGSSRVLHISIYGICE